MTFAEQMVMLAVVGPGLLLAAFMVAVLAYDQLESKLWWWRYEHKRRSGKVK